MPQRVRGRVFAPEEFGGQGFNQLEMYETIAAGALTVKGNPPFQRRKDLIDPTSSIDKAVFE